MVESYVHFGPNITWSFIGTGRSIAPPLEWSAARARALIEPQPTMVIVERSNGASDLDGILALQRLNLRGLVSEAEEKSQGFVTVSHTREVLASMHARLPSIVARRGDEVVGYALAMPIEARAEVPILEPMFAQFDRLSWAGRQLSSLRYYVMGQICIATSARGTGLFDALYAKHRELYAERFELLVTEISVRNTRSQRAHARVGFVELIRYSDPTDTWLVVGLRLAGP